MLDFVKQKCVLISLGKIGRLFCSGVGRDRHMRRARQFPNRWLNTYDRCKRSSRAGTKFVPIPRGPDPTDSREGCNRCELAMLRLQKWPLNGVSLRIMRYLDFHGRYLTHA